MVAVTFPGLEVVQFLYTWDGGKQRWQLALWIDIESSASCPVHTGSLQQSRWQRRIPWS